MVIFCTETIIKGLNLMASKMNTFKKKTKKDKNDKNLAVFIGSVLILLIVVISFILAPALSDLSNTNVADIEFGSYGKEKITFSRIENTPFQREIAQLTQNNNAQSSDYRTIRTAFNTTVTKAAAIDKFNENGYVITKEQIDKAVLESAIYNENGSFSVVRFKNTPESKKQEIRDEIERAEKINRYETYTIYDQKRSTNYIDFINSLSDTKRNFKYVTLSYSDYPTDLVVKYGKENNKKFRDYDLSMITVKDQKTADIILKKLKEKENSFNELAKEYSTDTFKDNGGKLSSVVQGIDVESYFKIDDLSELDDFTVNSDPIVVNRENTVILLKLNSDVTEADFTKDETLKNVKDYLLAYERGIVEDYFLNIANSANGDLLTLGREIKETGLFSLNYGSDQLISSSINRVSKDPIFNRAINNENFFKTLFTLNKDEISEPIVLGDSISVFRLTEEVIEESETEEYFNSLVKYYLGEYKKLVSQDLVLNSENFTDNFNQGYTLVTSEN